MRVLRHTPAPALAPYVECIWTLEGAPPPEFPRIPPFGEVELAFYHGEPFRYRQPGGVWEQAPGVHVTGPRTRYLDLIPGQFVDTTSVRFRPGAFHFFCSGSTPFIAEEVVNVEEIWGRTVRDLADRLARTGEPRDRFRLIEGFLWERLRTPSDPFVSEATGALGMLLARNEQENDSVPAVDVLARHLGLSRRTCQRRFQATFGLSPRGFYNLLRFESAVKDTLRGSALAGRQNLTDQALKFGYYDQSHFIKDFRKYIGRAPGDFLAGDGRFIEEII